MTGRLLALVIVIAALLVGGGVYYMQVYAFYHEVAPDAPAARVQLTAADGSVFDLPTEAFQGIDAESSPIRFRACFATPADVTAIRERARAYEGATPLNGPGWFSCYDAGTLTADLASGKAVALLGVENVRYGVDRVVALYPDGRGFEWMQLNECGEKVFSGDPPPEGCPPPPQGTN